MGSSLTPWNNTAKHISCLGYVYDCVFRVDQRNGAGVTVALVDAYNMSAEDVRNARTRVGHFDVIAKSSNYGSITDQAVCGRSIDGAEAHAFAGLMRRLAR